MSFEDWFAEGVDKGWISKAVCATHQGPPLTEKEFEDDEPCVTIVRLYGPEGPPADVG